MTGPHRTVTSRTIADLDRWRGRWLDTRRHPAVGPGAVRGSTAYAADGLLVMTSDPALRLRITETLTEAVAARGYHCEISGSHLRFLADEQSTGNSGPADRSDDESADLRVGSAPDPWAVITSVQQAGHPDVAAALGLDHLMSMAEQPGGNPFAIGHGRPGLDHYGDIGYPGRGPVAMAIRRPRARPVDVRPRVLVLDTGIGKHPWFRADPAVTRVEIPKSKPLGPRVDKNSIRAGGADGQGLIGDLMLGSLGTHAGHGTFIAGLLRQGCPEAEIVALAVMGSDGIVQERTLLTALTKVLRRVTADPGWLDALVLSLGYYAETADDLSYTSHLKDILLGFGRAGVAVFCAAGNDATSRPSYPAAFAADPACAGDPGVVPLSAVGALNADGSRAAFSNFGSWVNAWAPGVGLVSTVPVDAQGSDRSVVQVRSVGGRRRSALDPDDFNSGFASWSGTSFAAPVLAAGYLRDLVDASAPVRVQQRAELIRGRW